MVKRLTRPQPYEAIELANCCAEKTMNWLTLTLDKNQKRLQNVIEAAMKPGEGHLISGGFRDEKN